MKTIFLCLIALSILGCTREKKLDSATQSAKNSPKWHSNSLLFQEEDILFETKQAIQAGSSLTSELTLKCWDLEKQRRAVQIACMALWLNGDDQNEKLTAITKQIIGSEKDLIIVALKKRKILQELSYDDFLRAINFISDQPIWMQMKAIHLWLEKQEYIPTSHKMVLIRKIQAWNLSLPLDYKQAFYLLEKLGEDSHKNIISKECSSLMNGIARMRCWRVISSVIEMAQISEKERFRLYLPSFKDPDWIFFRRSFPHLARLIETNYL